MHRRHPPAPLPTRLWRVMALFAAGLVMLLSFSAVNPELHAWLHEQHADHSDHSCSHASSATDTVPDSGSEAGENHACAVTLFAHGVVHQVAALLTQPCEGILRAVNFRAFERLALAQPRYLHRPPQAPPAV
jgi:hypothetical protein